MYLRKKLGFIYFKWYPSIFLINSLYELKAEYDMGFGALLFWIFAIDDITNASFTWIVSFRSWKVGHTHIGNIPHSWYRAFGKIELDYHSGREYVISTRSFRINARVLHYSLQVHLRLNRLNRVFFSYIPYTAHISHGIITYAVRYRGFPSTQHSISHARRFNRLSFGQRRTGFRSFFFDSIWLV